MKDFEASVLWFFKLGFRVQVWGSVEKRCLGNRFKRVLACGRTSNRLILRAH